MSAAGRIVTHDRSFPLCSYRPLPFSIFHFLYSTAGAAADNQTIERPCQTLGSLAGCLLLRCNLHLGRRQHPAGARASIWGPLSVD